MDGMMKQLELGEQRKDKGISLVKNVDQQWMEGACEAVRRLALGMLDFTSDDARRYCRDFGLPRPHHPNCWGAVFNSLAKQGLIERIGYRKSLTPSTHARVVGVWRRK